MIAVLVACGPRIDDAQGEGSGMSSTGEGSTSTSTSTSTTSTSTSTSTSSSGSSESSHGHVVFDEGPCFYSCDVWEQNCGDGSQCNPTNLCEGGETWGSTRCRPLDRDPAAIGEPCTVEESPYSGIESCGTDGFCWNVDPETLEGVCVALCTGSPEFPICADPNTTCLIANDGALPLCLAACDPLLQDCDEGEGCHPLAFAGDFVCMPTGAPIETDQHPTMCEPGSTDVPSELLCRPDAEVCCAAFCDVQRPQCDAGLECTDWYEPGVGFPPPIGICILPG